MNSLAPALGGDEGPYGLDYAEGPSPLQEAVDRRQRAANGECEDKPGAQAETEDNPPIDLPPNEKELEYAIQEMHDGGETNSEIASLN